MHPLTETSFHANIYSEDNYRLQGKVMFSEACVILFTWGGVGQTLRLETEPPSPLEADPPEVGTPIPRVLTSNGGHCSGR